METNKKRNFQLPFLTQSQRRMMINENDESVKQLSHDVSITSMVSAFRSERTQKTLN